MASCFYSKHCTGQVVRQRIQRVIVKGISQKAQKLAAQKLRETFRTQVCHAFRPLFLEFGTYKGIYSFSRTRVKKFLSSFPA